MRKIKIDFNKHNLEEKINNAREAFNKEYYLEYELDLSRLNLIDSSKIALLLPAELMKKNTKSKINCLLKDNETLNIISSRKLKNTFLSVTLNRNTLNSNVRKFQYKNIEQKNDNCFFFIS